MTAFLKNLGRKYRTHLKILEKQHPQIRTVFYTMVINLKHAGNIDTMFFLSKCTIYTKQAQEIS